MGEGGAVGRLARTRSATDRTGEGERPYSGRSTVVAEQSTEAGLALKYTKREWRRVGPSGQFKPAGDAGGSGGQRKALLAGCTESRGPFALTRLLECS